MLSAHAIKAIAVLALGTALAASPSLANNGKGNGGGSGGGNGNGKSNVEHSERKTFDTASAVVIQAKALGKLNGFMHASATALTHASPNSEIGKVAKVYAGLLQSYLTSPGVTVQLTQLKAALLAAANKPLSADIIAAINAKLALVNPTLLPLISDYKGGGSTGGASVLATDIYNAI